MSYFNNARNGNKTNKTCNGITFQTANDGTSIIMTVDTVTSNGDVISNQLGKLKRDRAGNWQILGANGKFVDMSKITK